MVHYFIYRFIYLDSRTNFIFQNFIRLFMLNLIFLNRKLLLIKVFHTKLLLDSWINLTYIQQRFCQEINPPLYFISSKVLPVTGLKSRGIAVNAIRPPGFWSFLVSSAFRRSLAPLIYHVSRVVQSIALHNTTPMTFGLLNSVSNSKLYLLLYTASTILLYHISCGEPSSQKRVIGSLSSLSAPTFHCLTAVQQDRVDQGLVDR
jgi:hypothetical protein